VCSLLCIYSTIHTRAGCFLFASILGSVTVHHSAENILQSHDGREKAWMSLRCCHGFSRFSHVCICRVWWGVCRFRRCQSSFAVLPYAVVRFSTLSGFGERETAVVLFMYGVVGSSRCRRGIYMHMVVHLPVAVLWGGEYATLVVL